MCTLVQALRQCTGHTAHRGSRRIALLFLDHGTRRGWGVSITPRPLFTPGKDPVPIVQEAGWATGPVWTGAENFAPTGIRTLDRRARSKSLYRLCYPGHRMLVRHITYVGLPLRRPPVFSTSVWRKTGDSQFKVHTAFPTHAAKFTSDNVLRWDLIAITTHFLYLIPMASVTRIRTNVWGSCLRYAWQCISSHLSAYGGKWLKQ